jgi:hypothetical protein
MLINTFSHGLSLPLIFAYVKKSLVLNMSVEVIGSELSAEVLFLAFVLII